MDYIKLKKQIALLTQFYGETKATREKSLMYKNQT